MFIRHLTKLFVFVFLIFICIEASGQKKYETKEVYPVVNNQYLPVLIDLINSSKKSIYICHFLWNPDSTTNKIKNAVYEAINRGVKVRVILEDSLKQNSQIIKEFSSLHIPIKTDAKTEWPRNLLHAKLIIIDSQKVLLGSTNLSFKAINENNEANVLVNSPEIARFYENFFDALWEKRKSGAARRSLTTKYVTATIDRDYFTFMKNRVSKATKKIGMIFYGMKVYPGNKNEVMEFVDEIVAAKKRGVDVKVILEKSDYDEKLNRGNSESIEYLKKKGINAKFEFPERITHAKLIIVDDEAVGVASANFALTGFKFYTEAGVITTEPETIESFWNYFEKLWRGENPW